MTFLFFHFLTAYNYQEICLKGAIWVFADYTRNLVDPPIAIVYQHQQIITLSDINGIVYRLYPGEPVNTAFYKNGSADEVVIKKWGNNPLFVFFDPYAGEVLHKRALEDRLTHPEISIVLNALALV